MRKDIFFSALAVIVVVALAALIRAKGPPLPLPIPRWVAPIPGPNGRFLWLFGLLSLSPPEAENVHHSRVPGPLDFGPVRCSVHLQSR